MQFNMTLEERVGERTRIARDLHDTLLQSFHGVLLHFQTGIHLLPEHPEPKRKRNIRGRDAIRRSEAIIEGREAVQGLRASTVERNDLALAMRTLGEELARPTAGRTGRNSVCRWRARRAICIRFFATKSTGLLGKRMRNAFRHADAKQIEVEIHYDERQLRLRVRDDGKGIDPKLLSDDGREGHFGLRGMRERAKLIGGKLTVWSELDAGTEVELSIPASSRVHDSQRGTAIVVGREVLAKLSGKDTVSKSHERRGEPDSDSGGRRPSSRA